MPQFYNQIAEDFDVGFSAPEKFIPSKYFYDEIGSELFNQITQSPEYYLTNCEIEILNHHGKSIARQIGQKNGNGKMRIIELGAGRGVKAELILSAFHQIFDHIEYTAIDISVESNDLLKARLQNFSFVKTYHGEYLDGIANLCQPENETPLLLMFLGANLGNFSPDEAINFMLGLAQFMRPQDFLLVGIDLWKESEILLPAYSDSQGITAKFNFNLLTRFNRELQTNFQPELFTHLAIYNDKLHAMESYLIAQNDMNIYSKLLNKSYFLKKNEAIFTERSIKYTLQDFAALLEQANLKIAVNYSDKRNYFYDCLCQLR